MLFAQFQPQNQAQATGFLIGVIIAMIVCGLTPLVTAIICGVKLYSKGSDGWRIAIVVVLGLLGAPVASVIAFPLGCLGGLPTALFFTIPIIIVAATAPEPRRRRRRRRYDDNDEDEDDYDRPRRRKRRMRADERRDLEEEGGIDPDDRDRRHDRPDYY